MDLARGHVAALKALHDNNITRKNNEKNNRGEDGRVCIYNLGTGRGYSVLEMVKTFERVNKVKVPFIIEGRRAGDIGVCYSDPSKAMRELDWKAEYGLEEMCRDSWNWERQHSFFYIN